MTSPPISKIEATYEVVSPLFCGGADGRSAELRLPSFKGGLRFWWRALAWSRFGGDLPRIKSAEDELFGSAQGGQARVRMRLSSKRRGRVFATGRVIDLGAGARYLGYGLLSAQSERGRPTVAKLTRSCLEEPMKFTVLMRLRGLADESEHLLRALRAYGMFGGMGARSRRGYGSLVLRSLTGWSAATSSSDLHLELLDLLEGRANGPVPAAYTAFTKRVRVVVARGTERENTRDLLDRVGREMVRFRSWGRRGKILGHVDTERNFEPDHDLMKMKPWQRGMHPRRVAFGLPHNYGKKSEEQVGPDGSLDRRAGPLFIHMHTIGGRPYAILTLLPSRFLPEGVGISVGGQVIPCLPDAALYAPVNEFLDRMLDSDLRVESFDNVSEVGR